MPPWVQDILVGLIPATIIAAFTAVATVHLALRRFRSERWWDRKAEAYSRIVESLVSAVTYFDVMIDYWENNPGDTTKKGREDLQERYEVARLELKKAAGIGAFIISSDAVDALRELEKRPALSWDDEPPWEIFSAELRAHEKALGTIREIARRDLRVR